MKALTADTFLRHEMSKPTLLKTLIGREDLDVLNTASKSYRLTNERCLLVIKLSADETRIEDRKELAERLGIQEGTLKTRVCRTRLDLERCARRCLAAHKTDLL